MLFLSSLNFSLKSSVGAESREDILNQCLSPEYISETKENQTKAFCAWSFVGVTLFSDRQLNASPHAKSCVAK